MTLEFIESENYLIATIFEVPSQQLWAWGRLTTTFWKTPYNWRFHGYGPTYVLILSRKPEKKSWNENRRRFLWRVTSCTKIWVCTSNNIAPKQITFHFFLYTFFSLKQTYNHGHNILGLFDAWPNHLRFKWNEAWLFLENIKKISKLHRL